jgi:hypothetical protein
MGYFYPDGKISRDRGTLIKVGEYNIFPVYHPAAALRNPTMMKDFISDFIKIPNVIKKLDLAKEASQSFGVKAGGKGQHGFDF